MNTDPALQPPPEPLVDLINAFARFVAQAVGVSPDLTSDTLPLVDHYLEYLDRDSTARELVVEAGGAYFGEVLRIHLGDGKWESTDGDWTLRFGRCSLALRPADVITEVLERGEPAPLQMDTVDREVAAQALARLGDINPDDYYRVAVRLEAFETLHRALTNARIRRQAN